jgi:hypothetical protein
MRIIFSITFCSPTFCAANVPKQPQSISRFLNTAIITANVKTIIIDVIIIEFSLLLIPKSRSIPEINSSHGNIIAIRFIEILGATYNFR